MDPESSSASEPSATSVEADSAAVVPHRGFSVATLMMIVTLLSLLCGLASWAPGIGLAAAIVALPALVRTSLIARRQPSSDSINKLSGRIALFGSSICFVVVFGLACGVCCYATCWPGVFLGLTVGEKLLGPEEYLLGMVVGFSAGGIVASLLGYLAMTRLAFPTPIWRPSRGEKLVVAATVILSVVGGYFLFFGWIMRW